MAIAEAHHPLRESSKIMDLDDLVPVERAFMSVEKAVAAFEHKSG